MPLWVAVPLVTGLWIASWISSLDSTGNLRDATMMWSVTAIATALLAMRLIRMLTDRV